MAERQPTRGSFAFQPAAAVQTSRQSRGPSIGPIGNAGGGQSRSGVVRSENPSLNVNAGASLPGFLEKVVEPVMQEAQRERMFKGFAAARAGQTMQEIADEQPELTAIFGQSDYERGASLYYQRKAMNDLTTEVSTNMQQYAAMKPEEAYQAIWEQANSHRTGVRETDNALDAMMIEAMDQLMPTVTREQIKFRETSLTNGAIQAQVSGGTAYEQMFRAAQADPANSDPDAIAAKGIEWLRGFEVAGVTAEGRSKVMAQVSRGLIANNNFRAFDLLSEGGTTSRLFALVGHDDATYQSILSQAQSAKRKYFGETILSSPELQTEYNTIISKREAKVYGNATEYMEDLREWSGKAAAQMGINPQDILTWEEEAREGRTYMGVLVSDAEQSQRRAEDWARNPSNPVNREREALETQSDIIAGFATGIDSAMHTDTERDDVMVSLISQNPQAAANAMVTRHRNGYAALDKSAKFIQQRTFQQPELGPESQGFQTSLGMWKQMQAPENDRARIAYFGRDLDQAMRNYVNDTERNLPADMAYANRISRNTANPVYQTGATPSQSIKDEIAKFQPEWWRLGQRGLNDASLSVAQSRIGAEAAEVAAENAGWPVDRVVRVAENNMRSERLLDRVGPYMWETPSRSPSMQAITGMQEEVLGTALQGVINESMNLPRFRQQGIKAEQLSIVYTGDSSGGDARWFIFAPNKDGNLVVDEITPARIKAYDERHLATQRREAMRPRRVLPPASANEQLRGAGRAGSVFRR